MTRQKNGVKPVFHPVIIVISYVITISGIGFAVILLIYGIVGEVVNLKRKKHLNFGKNGFKLPKFKEIPYYREIPCKGNLYKAYWLIYYYNIGGMKKSCREGLMGAFFLKWIKEGLVDICKNKKGILDVKRNNYSLNLKKLITSEDELENGLIQMLKSACGDNEILEYKEFKKWCYNHYISIDNWFQKVLDTTDIQFIDEGLIQIKPDKKRPHLSNYYVNKSIKNRAIELCGLRKYLLDYSLIQEREAIEVELWDDYLVYAQLLGIANKVQKQFTKLYPNFSDISNINLDYASIVATNMFYDGIKSARRGRYVSEFQSSSGSGGGGSSYSGGGSSSSGFSSGGGFR